jgi:hypothetical protein
LFAIDPGRGGIQGYILFDNAELQGIVQGVSIGGIGVVYNTGSGVVQEIPGGVFTGKIHRICRR